MALLVSTFINPAPDSQQYHAIQKALREQPKVTPIGEVEGRRYFEVTSTSKLGPKYPVCMWEDNDYDIIERDGELFISEHGQFWIECYCKGAYPPTDTASGIIAWQPKACYHIAAVLIYDSETPEKQVDLEEALPLDF